VTEKGDPNALTDTLSWTGCRSECSRRFLAIEQNAQDGPERRMAV